MSDSTLPPAVAATDPTRPADPVHACDVAVGVDHPHKRRWDRYSEVRKCGTCNGAGTETVWIGVYGTSNCKGPDERECHECHGAGMHTCKVCGFDHVVTGYDCAACALVLELDDRQLTIEVANSLYESIIAAMAARRAAQVRQ